MSTIALFFSHHVTCQCKKDSPYSITERRVSELILVLGSQPVGDVSHKPARPAVTPATLNRAATSVCIAGITTIIIHMS